MSTGEERGNRDHAHQEVVVRNAIEQVAEPQEPSTTKRPAGGSRWRSSSAGAARAQPVRAIHPEFRTEVAVGDLTVTGVLPGTVRQPEGSVAISGDVHRLSCDRALELVDALLLVVTRMDVVAEKRLTATVVAMGDRRD